MTVQIWRLDVASGKPSTPERHRFIVSSDSQSWEDAEILSDFSAGLTFLTPGFYDTPTDGAKSLFCRWAGWLRVSVIGFWALHVEAGEHAKESQCGGGEIDDELSWVVCVSQLTPGWGKWSKCLRGLYGVFK